MVICFRLTKHRDSGGNLSYDASLMKFGLIIEELKFTPFFTYFGTDLYEVIIIFSRPFKK